MMYIANPSLDPVAIPINHPKDGLRVRFQPR